MACVTLYRQHAENGSQDLRACVKMMHTVGTTVMRCVELCARRLGPALVGRWNERGTDYDKKLMFTV